MNDLIQGLKAGDGRAFEQLVQEFGDRVHRYVARLAGVEGAEDLTQEVFLRVYRSIGSFEPSGGLAPWIFTIATHLSVDQLRKRKAVPEGPIRPNHSGDPIEARELRETLFEAIARLPEDQRRVFHLREEAGLSFREIAQVLRCPPGTALWRMHAAMTRLRKALKAHLEK